MKNIVKKIVVYSMVGMLQIGFGASIVSASPAHGPERIQYSEEYHNHDNYRQHEHDKRMREENKRHDWEMRRRHDESVREWRERQERENKRHDSVLNEIGAFLLGVIVGSASN
ncbi:MAG: hypothetical protein ABFC84_07080 [Veillonellales bacterium]